MCDETDPPPLAAELVAALDGDRLDFAADALARARNSPPWLRTRRKPATFHNSPRDRAKPSSRFGKPVSCLANSAARRWWNDPRPSSIVATSRKGPARAARLAHRGKRRPMLQAPTGFGKTLTAAHIIARALDKGKRVAFTVPSINLIDQTVAAFEAEGIHCLGVLQGVHPKTDREQPVQVCSVQTLPDGSGWTSILSSSTRRTAFTATCFAGCRIARIFRSSACRPRPGLAAWANIMTT